MTTKIFVRERSRVEKGDRRPRYRVVGVSGSDVKLYVGHIRKKELDQINQASGAEIVYLDAGKGQKDGGGKTA